MSKASDEGPLNLEEVRLVADLRIMHAKVFELFEIVSVIKKRHDEGAIRRCSDHVMLDQDIGGTATIVMSHRDGMLVFAAAGLRQLPAAQHYE
ncbi:MAG TPA: hypothetical protein VNB54_03615, partial [Alphaproteobacteria bacterium]|nr:hypothetical protein [Alphaproteobacteria bacterium]